VALFHPLTVPLLATDAPAHRLADLFSLFHLWLAGFAAYLLVRDVTSSESAASFGGVAWMLSARMVQSVLWPNAVAVSALLPLILLGMIRIGRGRRRSGVLFAAVSGGLALLAFRPQVLIGAAPVVAAVAVAAVVASPSRRRALSDLAAALLLALAIGAPALLTSAALYPLTSRAGGLSTAERNLRPITFHRDLDQVFLPVDGAPRWPEAAAYPGAIAGLLFVGGVVFAARRADGFPRGLFLALAIGGAVGLVFAFGERGPYGLFAGLPVLRDFRIPARYLVSWSLAVSIGSALAAAHVLARSGRRTLGAAAVVLLTADLVWHARFAAATAPAAVYETEPAILPAVRERLSRLDEAGFPARLWPLAPPPDFVAYPDEEKLTAARELEPIAFGLGMRYGLESVHGQGPTLRRSDVLFQKPTDRAAELGGVGGFVERPRFSIRPDASFREFSPLPRAILVPEVVAVPASSAVAATLDPAFDPRRTALLEADVTAAPVGAWSATDAAVRLVSRESGRIELEANAPAAAVLVLFNSFERGWRAFVDGSETPVYRADAAFLGIRTPAGRHRIRFEYRPRGLREGLFLGAAGLLGLVLVAVKLPAGAA
jgi:membrane protein YfhO